MHFGLEAVSSCRRERNPLGSADRIRRIQSLRKAPGFPSSSRVCIDTWNRTPRAWLQLRRTQREPFQGLSRDGRGEQQLWTETNIQSLCRLVAQQNDS